MRLLLLSLGVLALACADRGVTPPPGQATAADSADQVLFGMTTTITADGVRRSLIHADTTIMYQDRQVAELITVRADFFDLSGQPTFTLTSREGTYEFSIGTLIARGSVVVTAADGSGRRLTTEHLIYDANQNQVRSDSSFVYTSPDGVIRGDSFVSDPEFRNITTNRPRGRQLGGSGTGLLPGR